MIRLASGSECSKRETVTTVVPASFDLAISFLTAVWNYCAFYSCEVRLLDKPRYDINCSCSKHRGEYKNTSNQVHACDRILSIFSDTSFDMEYLPERDYYKKAHTTHRVHDAEAAMIKAHLT